MKSCVCKEKEKQKDICGLGCAYACVCVYTWYDIANKMNVCNVYGMLFGLEFADFCPSNGKAIKSNSNQSIIQHFTN